MLDFTQVKDFQRRLVDASDTSDVESAWKRDTAQDLAQEIRPPVNTGALKASVHAVEDGVAMLDYWRFVEYGTVHMNARPFVRPAVARQTPQAVENLGDRVIRELL